MLVISQTKNLNDFGKDIRQFVLIFTSLQNYVGAAQ
jgi:hypothetical protein